VYNQFQFCPLPADLWIGLLFGTSFASKKLNVLFGQELFKEETMGFSERSAIIREIEAYRGSRVLTYVMSDRTGFPPGFVLPGQNAQLAGEAIYFIYEQLKNIGKVDKLDLFLYTRGGEVDSVWPLVNICREYVRQRFSVLVPFRAHSGGTMICLGADETVMSECAELSPVDPTTGNQFNPVDELTRQRRGISVEDVTSYIELAMDPSKRSEVAGKDQPEFEEDRQHERILQAFKRLSETVDPVALGNVNRAHTQIRLLSEKLLTLAANGQNLDIKRIVNYLTKSLYSHGHAINRNEARLILGDRIKDADDSEQRLLWNLYKEYAATLLLNQPLCQDAIVQEAIANPNRVIALNGAFIETAIQSTIFKSHFTLQPTQQIPANIHVQVPPGQPLPMIPGVAVNVQYKMIDLSWRANEEGV